MPRPLFTPGKDPISTVQEAGWAPRPVWTVAANLAPTGIRSPDRPSSNQSLYRLSYSGPQILAVPLYELHKLKQYETLFVIKHNNFLEA
jgi:hypothetical protein